MWQQESDKINMGRDLLNNYQTEIQHRIFSMQHAI